MNNNVKSKYISSALILISASVIVKIISALYKIPLTSFIGATGRGYFAVAYNLFMPIHIITMGSLPIALSQLVSKYNANNRIKMVYAIKKGSDKFFLLVAIICIFVVAMFSTPYCNYVAKSPNSIYTVYAIIPVILFSTIGASYRGFSEGHLNMIPTSVSQTIDVVVKSIFGMLFAKLSMAYLYNAYLNKSLPMFQNVCSDRDALSLIYPITTACAMLGSCFGAFASYLYLKFYFDYKYKRRIKLEPNLIKMSTNKLIRFSLSLMLSCTVQSVFQFLDTASVQIAITSLSIDEIKNILIESLKYTQLKDSDLHTYIYGIFNSALDFKNIIPGITMAIGVCAVPAISGAYSSNNILKLNSLSNTIFKYTTLLSTFCGSFLFLESKNILDLFYISNPDIVFGCNNLVKLFSITIVPYCVAGTAVFCVQAIGSPKKTIKPFIIGGIVRTALNVLLVSVPNINLYGTVISGLCGYTIISVLDIIIFIKCSKSKLSIKNCFFYPNILAIITCIIYKFCLKMIDITDNSLLLIITKSLIFIVIYLFCGFVFNILDIKELKMGTNSKKHG